MAGVESKSITKLVSEARLALSNLSNEVVGLVGSLKEIQGNSELARQIIETMCSQLSKEEYDRIYGNPRGNSANS